jgi:hypothetical protein
VGILGGITGVLGGAWLMLAPFALGYQPNNAAWADATKVDVFTGIGILVLGLVSVAVMATSMARPAPEANEPAGAPARRCPSYATTVTGVPPSAPSGATGHACGGPWPAGPAWPRGGGGRRGRGR